MGIFSSLDASIDGDEYIQKLATYIRKNEESLANGLLCFSKIQENQPSLSKIKPLRLSFTMHHLYYITERISRSSLDVDVGPLNIKSDNPNHEPTFISFMANKSRSSNRHFDSDNRSITSIDSVRSIVSNASFYWRSFRVSKDPKVINKDIKYLYSSFTKIPCLIFNPKTKINTISSYEEYPCDTSVPIQMFKNLQVLEIIEYDPNEIFGWHILSEQLRILIIRKANITSVEEVMFQLVDDDALGRQSFNSTSSSLSSSSFSSAGISRANTITANSTIPENASFYSNHNKFRPKKTYTTNNGLERINSRHSTGKNKATSSSSSTSRDTRWSLLKQLTISETSISSVNRQSFKNLTNLVKLNLSSNLLESVPEGLEQLTNLRYLNLADNKITNLKGVENIISLIKLDIRKIPLRIYNH